MPLTPVNHSIGDPFIELQSIDSTNNYALSEIHANLAVAGACYFAHHQTAGRGQRGNQWSSGLDANLAMSVAVQPSLGIHEQFLLSCQVALAIRDVLEKIAGEGFRVKWPNDIYWNTRKIGGILIENVIGARETIEGVVPVAPHMTGDLSNRSNQWKWAVTGIGINVNESGFPFGLGGAVSLFQITGQRTDPVKLAHLVCGNLANYLTNPVADLHSIIESYNQNLYCLGENVSFRRAGIRFTAIVKGVTASGELVIRHAIDESVRHGEIEWLTPAH